MHAPEVNAENYEEIYQYYGDIEQHRKIIHSIQMAMGLVYRPHIHFSEGADAEIDKRLKENDRIIIASNHLNIGDQFPIAAAVEKTDVLKPLGGRIFALSKPSYFRKSYLRPALDASGTLPVFRPQDVVDKKIQAAATKSMIDVAAERLKTGWSMLGFPEGTRNTGDPKTIGKLRGGIGRIASKASESIGVSVIPVALWYKQDEKQHYFRPDILIGNPIVGPFSTRLDVMNPLSFALQTCVRQVSERDY